MSELKGKHFVLGMTGGIAAYKVAELCRELKRRGADVQVVMTQGACEFITPVTMQALSGNPVYTSQWDLRQHNAMAHINLTRQADGIIVAPASADFIAQLAHGEGQELLALLCLARPIASCPLLVVPAMNREMWLHPATQRNVKQIQEDGAYILGPASGDQACGEMGDGRMLEAIEIAQIVSQFYHPKWLQGKKVLITAGPTFEPLDPVRGMTNLSSGKMGFAIAEAAQSAGADVTLVAGTVALSTPMGVRRINVQTAQEMLKAVEQVLDTEDDQNMSLFVATAAVADWRPALTSSEKIKKDQNGVLPEIQWVENPDILATVAKRPNAPYCVGFAAESHHLEEYAQQKRIRKNIPLIVGNIGPETFGKDDNALLLIDAQGSKELPRASKSELAKQLIQEIASRLK